MRILLACEFFHPSVGGVQEVIRQLGRRFVERGHKVVVATSFLPERGTPTFEGMTIEEFRVSGNMVSGMKGELARYRDYVLRQEYDVLLIKAAQQWSFDALTPVLSEITKPKIFVPCGFSGFFDPNYASYFSQMPEWLAKFDRLIFYASEYRDIDFARKHGLRNLFVLSNGADEREFKDVPSAGFRRGHGISSEAFVVLTVGSLTGLKGHKEVAKAFERCDFGGRKAFLILNGNRPRRPKIGEQGWFANSPFAEPLDTAIAMYRTGGAMRVTKWLLRSALEYLRLDWIRAHLGYPATLEDVVARINKYPNKTAVICNLPRSQLIQAYFESDLFVFASNVEYSPLVLFEAAAAGLPFLSVPVGNASEIARWTGGGVICAADQDARGLIKVDVNQLAAQMAHLARTPETLQRLGAIGRRNWQERFTWDVISRKYEAIFEECLDRTPA